MNTTVIDAAPPLAMQQAQQQPVAMRQAGAMVAAPPPTPGDLLRIAVEGGADLDRLERLMALQERWDANEARREFVQAMTEFKREPLDIFKRKHVSFTTRDGDTTSYNHATLADVADVVVPAMARHGLSHRWDVRQEAGRIHVTCVVTHKRGHSETVALDAAPDDSGKKNNIQRVASAVTYLQRYTLLLATGLATKDQADDDGRDADSGGETDISDLLSDLYAITDDQKALQFWQLKRETLRADKAAYDRFKTAVAEHRRGIAEGKQ